MCIYVPMRLCGSKFFLIAEITSRWENLTPFGKDKKEQTCAIFIREQTTRYARYRY